MYTEIAIFYKLAYGGEKMQYIWYERVYHTSVFDSQSRVRWIKLRCWFKWLTKQHFLIKINLEIPAPPAMIMVPWKVWNIRQTETLQFVRTSKHELTRWLLVGVAENDVSMSPIKNSETLWSKRRKKMNTKL